MQILNDNVLNALRATPDCYYDLTFSDPPYNLDTKWKIERNPNSPFFGGYVVVGKSNDFMKKWDGLDEVFLREYFQELYRVSKHGAFSLFYGFMRQSKAFLYYAQEAGFIVDYEPFAQYYLQNMPKSTDCSLAIDKRAFGEWLALPENIGFKMELERLKKTDKELHKTREAEIQLLAGLMREVVGKVNNYGDGSIRKKSKPAGDFNGEREVDFDGYVNITKGATPLSRFFDGYKYGVACLKQTLEYCFIIQKPRKHGSFVDDAKAWEAGEQDISPCAFNVAGSRVGNREKEQFTGAKTGKSNCYSDYNYEKSPLPLPEGRFPAYTLLQEQPRFALDLPTDCEQNVFCFEYYEIDTTLYSPKGLQAIMLAYNAIPSTKEVLDAHSSMLVSKWGGSSKILQNAIFQVADFDIVRYQPKVNKKERNAGCEEFEEKEARIMGGEAMGVGNPSAGMFADRENLKRNDHPTLKSIDMNAYITKLFLMPYDMRVCVCFCGSGSELLGLVKAGFAPELITGIEINPDYVSIAQARIAHWLQEWRKEAVLHVHKRDLPPTSQNIAPTPEPPQKQIGLF